MCGAPSIPTPSDPVLPPPAAQASGSVAAQGAGAAQRARVANMAGPMQMIQNAGGAAGLVTPASTTLKPVLGA